MHTTNDGDVPDHYDTFKPIINNVKFYKSIDMFVLFYSIDFINVRTYVCVFFFNFLNVLISSKNRLHYGYLRDYDDDYFLFAQMRFFHQCDLVIWQKRVRNRVKY